jgi:hypothetical protein
VSIPQSSSTLALSVSPPPIHALAAKALAGLDAIEAMLALDIVIHPNDKNQLFALNRVSDEAIVLASEIVAESPKRFPDFGGLRAAAEYVDALGPFAARAIELATHVQNSLQNQRAPAANAALVLYGVVKHLGRLVENETMREKVALLKVEVAPKRKNRQPLLTKAEKAAKQAARQHGARIEKAKALLANEPSAAPKEGVDA